MKVEEDHTMRRDEHIAGTKPPGAWIAALLLAVAPLTVNANGTGSGDIVVTSASGDARLEHRGAEHPARRGAVVLLPSTVHTGHDGAMDLAQGATTLSIGADTDLEFPEGPAHGAPVERIVQKSGKAFYDIAKRGGNKLRVETPYLVAVIKGTQFSVSVQDGATSISLVEGQLQILSPEDDARVEINAGQIASRRQGDAEIAVVSATGPQVRVPGATGAVASVDDRPAGGAIGAVATVGGVAAVATTVAGTNVRAGLDAVATAVTATVSVDTDTTLALGGSRIDVDAGVGIGVDTGTGIAVDAGVGIGVDTGTGIDVDAGAGLGVDTGTGIGIDAGAGVGVDTGTGIGIDAGAGVGIDTGTGIAGVDTSVGVDVGADVTPTSVDVGLGVDVGGVSVDVDVGAATGGVDTIITTVLSPVDTGAETLTTVVDDVGGLLSGLPIGLRKTP
jgi:hypothetical protein